MAVALIKTSLYQHYSVSWLTKRVPKNKCYFNGFVRVVFAYCLLKDVHFRTVVVQERTVFNVIAVIAISIVY